MPWKIILHDGPAKGERWWSGPAPYEIIYLMPHPTAPTDYILIGHTGFVPDVPWPEQVAYRIVERFPRDGPHEPGDNFGTVVYKQVVIE